MMNSALMYSLFQNRNRVLAFLVAAIVLEVGDFMLTVAAVKSVSSPTCCCGPVNE